MREKKFRLRRRLFGMEISYLVAGLLLPLILEFIFFFIQEPIEREQAGLLRNLFGLMILVQVISFIGIYVNFHRKIYKPVTAIEKVVHGVASGVTEVKTMEIGTDHELYELYRDLNSIFLTLEELAAKEARAVLMKKQAELDALQSQINPHFLYNTLESIRGQAMVYGIQEIEVMTKALANLFRYSISNEGTMVPFSRELKNIDSYLMIQQCRFHNKFEKIENIDKDVLDCLIPKLLIQPIVENAIHHGLEPKIGHGSLKLQAYRTRKQLIIHVMDDGVGMEEKQVLAINEVLGHRRGKETTKESEMRVGIVNVNERIQLAFGDTYGLHIYSTPYVGTDVEIRLPVLQEDAPQSA